MSAVLADELQCSRALHAALSSDGGYQLVVSGGVSLRSLDPRAEFVLQPFSGTLALSTVSARAVVLPSLRMYHARSSCTATGG
jgi:hypothetical protein